jgi:iron complex transport system permease protein
VRTSLSLGCLVAFFFALMSGVPVHWDNALDVSSPDYRILFELRLPRLFFVFWAGATLACVGAIYQILFLNPLAEPYLLGISTGATLAMAVGEVALGILAPSPGSQALGLGGALVVTISLLLVTFSNGGKETERIALFGLGVNFVLSSALFLLLSFHNQQVGGGSMRWLFGQIPWLSATQSISFALGAGVGILIAIASARSLDALQFGDGVAQTLGFSAKKIRLFYLSLTSLLLAWLVSYTGSIGFLGLVVPHFIRRIFQPSSTRRLLFYSAPLGGAFLLFADGCSRGLLPPLEFPIGIITTLIGGPLFLLLLWRKT